MGLEFSWWVYGFLMGVWFVDGHTKKKSWTRSIKKNDVLISIAHQEKKIIILGLG